VGEEFTRFVHDFRADLNAPNLPVVFAQLGTSDSKTSIRWEEVKASQAKVKIPHVTMIETDDLKRLDAVHFNTPSQEEIGRRFARALRELTKPSPSVSSAPSANSVKEIVYKKTPQGDLSLFVEYPPHWKASDKRAAIVFFFGGGWAKGTPQQFAEQAAYLAGRGMVTVRPDYRTSSKHKTTALESVEDARSAMRFVRAHASEWGMDASRIVGAAGQRAGILPPVVRWAANQTHPVTT
jgi:acetyl esterase/lipase